MAKIKVTTSDKYSIVIKDDAFDFYLLDDGQWDPADYEPSEGQEGDFENEKYHFLPELPAHQS